MKGCGDHYSRCSGAVKKKRREAGYNEPKRGGRCIGKEDGANIVEDFTVEE